MAEGTLSAEGQIDRSVNDWYKDAIIYQLHVKAFQDSTGDGIGDFAGLIQRLDYVESLGVNTLWLLPFYPSPLKDDGYDIADYRAINPTYGNMEQFDAFIAEAHRRGMRVITELVVNHTSDQHPWFERARGAPAGTTERDFYVWSDSDSRYRGTRIIFIDTESSNWTWDPVAKAYFWHRFYSHQPDLNYANPRVFDEIVTSLRFWLDKGVDGKGPTTRTCPRRMKSFAAYGPRWTRPMPTACFSPRPINGPRTPAPISAMAMNATWRSTFR
jgi:maltose alpha-D-glucosyltransferase/alpha-amylase